MKKATRIIGIAAGTLLCFFSVTRNARAVENVPTPAMTDEKTAKPPIVLALEAATDGLEMPSETDAPFRVVFFEHQIEEKHPEISLQELAALVGAPKEAKIETRDLEDFFEVPAATEEWMNEEEKATAARFADLLKILQTELKDAQVLVWGDAEKQVAIVGKVEGGLAGLTTIVVET